MEIAELAVNGIDRDPDQPRRDFLAGLLQELGNSILTNGQWVPIIVYASGKRYVLVDGERRWRAAQLVGKLTLFAVVLQSRPTATETAIAQAVITQHHAPISAMEKSNHLARVVKETGWGISEAAERLSMSQPAVTKSLAYQKLDPSVQAMLHDGSLSQEHAYIISQEPDLAKQRLLAKDSSSDSRDALRAKVKARGDAVEPKAASARFTMRGGLVSVQGNGLTLTTAIALLEETVKALRKGLRDGQTISTVGRVLRDRAKAVQS